ncbi:MAG: DUF2079 domain-containing protein [Lachnospiraceae bacterium]|nr:DUF2079 domain-containing protein [Lachnospiraceae bacterium]
MSEISNNKKKNTSKEDLKNRFEYKSVIEGLVLSGFAGIFLTNIIFNTYKPVDNLQYIQGENILVFFCAFFALTIMLGATYFYNKIIAKIILPILVIVYSFLTIINNYTTLPITVVCIIATLFAVIYSKKELLYIVSKYRTNERFSLTICCTMGLVLIIFITGIGYCRYKSFMSPGYDLGVFSQMFENMKRTLHPVTSVERQELGMFSHFGVHFSPILYLLLPVYCLLPSPITLQTIQAIVLGIAVVPLYYLCKHYGLSQKMTIAFCAIYCFFPATSAGTFYDFHENCILPVMIFCLLLSLEKKHTIGIMLATVGVLMIKEDAALVVLSIGLFLLLSAKDIKRGGILVGMSLVYFPVVMTIIKSYGDQNFEARFSNLFYDNSKGLIQIAVTIPSNISYMFAQMADLEKIEFIILMILPLSIALFQNKKYSRYVLLMTFVLINLLPSYKFMHDIGYQYNFSTIALMIYIAIMTVSEWDVEKRNTWALISVIITLMLFSSESFACFGTVSARYSGDQKIYKQMEHEISRVPSDATVAVSGFIMPHMYNNQNLKFIYEDLQIDQDYVVVDCRKVSNDEDIIRDKLSDNYEKISEVKDYLKIYKKK